LRSCRPVLSCWSHILSIVSAMFYLLLSHVLSTIVVMFELLLVIFSSNLLLIDSNSIFYLLLGVIFWPYIFDYVKSMVQILSFFMINVKVSNFFR
jgi:hypothetical protein